MIQLNLSLYYHQENLIWTIDIKILKTRKMVEFRNKWNENGNELLLLNEYSIITYWTLKKKSKRIDRTDKDKGAGFMMHLQGWIISYSGLTIKTIWQTNTFVNVTMIKSMDTFRPNIKKIYSARKIRSISSWKLSFYLQ